MRRTAAAAARRGMPHLDGQLEEALEAGLLAIAERVAEIITQVCGQRRGQRRIAAGGPGGDGVARRQPGVARRGQRREVRRASSAPGRPGPGRIDERQPGERPPRLAQVDLLHAGAGRVDGQRRIADDAARRRPPPASSSRAGAAGTNTGAMPHSLAHRIRQSATEVRELVSRASRSHALDRHAW